MKRFIEFLAAAQIVPRVIALSLAFTAIVLTIMIVRSILPVEGVAELSALSGLIVAFLSTSTALVGMLSRADSKQNGKD